MNWLNGKRQTTNTFLLYSCAPRKVATGIAVSISLVTATSAWSQPVPGSLDAHWNEGASDCKATPQAPLQVHAYEPQTFILRQSPCASFEANFLYLLIGSDKALLIDTGAIADPKEMPLAKTILELLPDKDHKKLPLLVAHTHRHLDHRAGDPQFASLPSVQIVPIDLEGVRAFYGFTDWPNGIAHLDLGGRTVDVIPTPGHNATHVAFYDNRTAILFSGDFLMPGRLLIDDAGASMVDLRNLEGVRSAALIRSRRRLRNVNISTAYFSRSSLVPLETIQPPAPTLWHESEYLNLSFVPGSESTPSARF